MTLQRKALTIVVVTFLCFMAALFVVLKCSVYRNYQVLEQTLAADHMQRLLTVLAGEITTIGGIVREWSRQDDSDEFVRAGSEAYRRTHLSDAAFAKLRLNLAVFIDAEGRKIYASGYDTGTGERREVPSEFCGVLGFLIEKRDDTDVTEGLVMLPGDISVLMGRSHVRDSSGQPIGSLVIGRYLMNSDARRLASYSGFSLRVHPAPDMKPPPGAEPVRSGLAGRSSVFIRPLDVESIAAYAYMRDAATDKPLMIEMRMPRGIYAEGLKTSLRLVTFVLVAGVVFMSAAVLFMQKHVIRFLGESISRLRSGVYSVAVSKNPSLRVPRTGRDELTLLADAINDMLLALELAQEEARMRQQQLIQADKMVTLGALVSGVAHEISNPNNFIMLNAPTMKKIFENLLPVLDRVYAEKGDFHVGRRTFSELRNEIPELLRGIQEGAERIERIVTDLKDFARMDAGKPLAENVDLNAVARSAVKLLSHRISKATTRFKEEYGSDLPLIRGNAQRLEQVVANLLLNACEALPDNEKSISLRTRYDRRSGQVVVTVADDGIGMEPNVLEHVTDPFFTTKRTSKGTGLGLSVSSGIVSSHGGTMRFESEPGRGTVVTVALPIGMADRTQEGVT